MVRERPDLVTVADEGKLGQKMLEQNSQLLRDGLRAAGISQATIDKLQVLDGMAQSAGQFLVASLSVTHRMMVYLSVSLLERADFIKREYLDDATLDDEIKIEWQEAYTNIVEQIGKSYDRTLTGTQAMAKMLGTEKPTEEKRKPGFKPLKRAEKTK